MIFNMSGGGAKVYAFINVTYPSGSTCTCTNGSKTLTAPNTSGEYVFCVPSAGTWTVTATSGTKSKSATVTISTQNQVADIKIIFELVVFNGSWASGYGLIKLTSGSSGSSASVNNASVSITYGQGAYVKAIDVTSYSTMTVTVSSNYVQWMIYGLSTDTIWHDGTTNMAVYEKTSSAGNVAQTTKTFDISNLSGIHYFKMYAYHSSATLNLHALRFD